MNRPGATALSGLPASVEDLRLSDGDLGNIDKVVGDMCYKLNPSFPYCNMEDLPPMYFRSRFVSVVASTLLRSSQ